MLFFAVGAASTAQAQGTIVDGPVSFVRGVSPWDGSPGADFKGVAANAAEDQLFEVGWWFRTTADTSESVLGTPSAQSYGGASSVIDWTDVGTRALFSAQEVTTVINLDPGSSPQGEVWMTLRLTNLSQVNSLTLDVFNMVDFDLGGTSGSDSAVLLPDGMHIRITDAGGVFAEYVAPGASAYLVRPFGATDVGAVLGNSAVDDFDNSGLPFGPGDFTAGMQWSGITLPPAGSQDLVVHLLVNAAAPPLDRIFADGFDMDNAPTIAPQ
ncbi:hypothetical protein [Dokdonella sp.]|uniref:hypothetical protein n=1 Tax=Dokdonella sp. TaxID=2291710 RepID=UPI0025BEE593|nr:hypothetical protein [Dokdonella sp.]MBX3689321.1 hypothetical protein [Dokdonella sp.]